MIQVHQGDCTPIAGQEQWQYFWYQWVPGDEEPELYTDYVLDHPDECSAAEVFTARLYKSDANIQLSRLSREEVALRTAYHGNGC